MRLIKIKIHNLASLKGEHEIDFSEIQKVSPLFAITGETGAGKSTILNAIGLALYGNLYRPQVTQTDVVTLGEKEASVQLIIALKNQYYLADWRARVRKQNGEPLKQAQIVRYLYKLEKGNFDSEKILIEDKAENLLGLNFDQFCKCIILNQGEFARFLMSSFTERKEILERLYPGEMLENLSKLIREELSEYQSQKQRLEIEREAISANHHYSLEDLKLELAKIKSKQKTVDQEQIAQEKASREIVSLKTYLLKFQETKLKKEKLFDELKGITHQINEQSFKIEKSLEAFEVIKAERIVKAPKLQLLLQKEERLEAIKLNLVELTKKQNSLQFEQKQLLDKKTAAAGQITKNGESLQTLKAALNFPDLSNQDFKNCAPKIQDYYTSLQILSSEKLALQTQLKEIEETGKKKAEEKKGLESKHEVLKKNLKEKTANENIEQFDEWKGQLATQIEQTQKAVIETGLLKNEIDQSTKNIQDLKLKENQHQDLILKIEGDLNPLELLSETIDLARAVSTCFTHETDACPVCHTTLGAQKIEKLKSEINEKLKFFDAVKLKDLRTRKEKTSTELHLIKSQKNAEAEKLQKAESIIAKLDKSASTTGSIEALKTLSLQAQQIFDEIKSLGKEITLKEKEIEERRAQYQKLKSEDTKQAARETELNKLKADILTLLGPISFPDLQIVKDEATKRDEVLIHEQKETHLKQEIEFISQMIEKNKIDLASITSEVNQKTTDSKDIQEELSASLNGESARTQWTKLEENFKLADEKHRSLEAEIKVIQLSQKEIQSRLYTFDDQIRDLETAYIQHTHEVSAIASESKLRKSNYELIWERLEKLEITLTAPIELLIPLEEMLNQNVANLREENKVLLGKLGELQQLLTETERRTDRVQLILKQLDEINLKYNRAERLFDVLGKDDLRNFALSMVEENLIKQTNLELEKLCNGRYQILHQTRKMKLAPEFYILDKYREGLVRKVSTLSGGETFMVSLCMALALGEMTRGTAEIDSLFIDEGFGTLDQDSLDEVLDMLQHIQARGLQIGLISHIQALTSRLSINLRLTKKSDGTSTTSLIYN